jgi:hypothetical protein
MTDFCVFLEVYKNVFHFAMFTVSTSGREEANNQFVFVLHFFIIHFEI